MTLVRRLRASGGRSTGGVANVCHGNFHRFSEVSAREGDPQPGLRGDAIAAAALGRRSAMPGGLAHLNAPCMSRLKRAASGSRGKRALPEAPAARRKGRAPRGEGSISERSAASNCSAGTTAAGRCEEAQCPQRPGTRLFCRLTYGVVFPRPVSRKPSAGDDGLGIPSPGAGTVQGRIPRRCRRCVYQIRCCWSHRSGRAGPPCGWRPPSHRSSPRPAFSLKALSMKKTSDQAAGPISAPDCRPAKTNGPFLRSRDRGKAWPHWK